MGSCRPGTALFGLAVVLGSVVLAVVGIRRTPVPASWQDGAGALFGPRIRAWYRSRIAPFEIALDRAGVSADALTYGQLVVSVLAGWAFWTGCLFLGGVLTCLAGTLDVLDGGLARRRGAASPRGAFVDSVVDRWAEAATFVGIGAYFRHGWVLLVVVAAAFGSQMVSYARARAEALGVAMTVGAVQRPERYVLLGFGAGLSAIASHLACATLGRRQDVILVAALVALAGVSVWTAATRTRHAYRALKERAAS
jgi:CDP-diacylglycerol--glycerol-3-phosphate 3-phosphatidyltransferase